MQNVIQSLKTTLEGMNVKPQISWRIESSSGYSLFSEFHRDSEEGQRYYIDENEFLKDGCSTYALGVYNWYADCSKYSPEHLAEFFGCEKINVMHCGEKIELIGADVKAVKAFEAYISKRPAIGSHNAHHGVTIVKRHVSNETEMRQAVNKFLHDNAETLRAPMISIFKTSHYAVRACGENWDSIFFFETREAYAECKPTIMTFGRYAKKYISEDSQEVERLVALWRKQFDPPEFKVSFDTDEIVAAYLSSHENGAGSCMSHPVNAYSTGGIHPTKVYGGDSDLGLAYLEKNGNVIARALVHKDKKVFVRIYPGRGEGSGMHYDMEKKLLENGFKLAYDFRGARLNRIDTRDGDIVCPYLDGNCQSVEVHRDALYISDDGQSAQGTEGVIEPYDSQCVSCGDGINTDDDNYRCTDDGDPYCQLCWDERFTCCDGCNETVRRDDVEEVQTRHGRLTYCTSCMENGCFGCDACGRNTINDLRTVTDDGYNICDGCLKNHSAECDDCGNVYMDDDSLHTSQMDKCNRCDDCHYDHQAEYSFGLIHEIGRLTVRMPIIQQNGEYFSDSLLCVMIGAVFIDAPQLSPQFVYAS